MENENQQQNLNGNHINGIIKITSIPKSPEEIQKPIQKIDENKFNPFVTVGGIFGNMGFPMDTED